MVINDHHGLWVSKSIRMVFVWHCALHFEEYPDSLHQFGTIVLTKISQSQQSWLKVRLNHAQAPLVKGIEPGDFWLVGNNHPLRHKYVARVFTRVERFPVT